MEAHAKLRKLRISPRKTRLVVDAIRGKKVPQALGILSNAPKKAALPIKKLLLSAVANWHQRPPQDRGEDESPLYIKQVQVGSAGMLKRIKPAPQGRAHRIRKRSSHVTLVVAKHTTAPQISETLTKQ